ncbi:hypothetical protein [Paenibacillus sinensis]|uniref:hypothetical protein n=1 Tax=Paenibacillus sinensis TaxID=2834413 RepID=UPI001CA8BA5D|nr:hypothetical protein [Paenibacillus sinensis]
MDNGHPGGLGSDFNIGQPAEKIGILDRRINERKKAGKGFDGGYRTLYNKDISPGPISPESGPEQFSFLSNYSPLSIFFQYFQSTLYDFESTGLFHFVMPYHAL